MTALVLGRVDSCLADDRRIDYPKGKKELLFELRSKDDYEGVVKSVSFDQSGETWLATIDTLYRIVDGKARVEAKNMEKARLVLAPGAGMYAWLTRGRSYGRFDVKLVQLGGDKSVVLDGSVGGIDGLYLGLNGRIVVTTSPLDDWEGVRGSVAYQFWSSDGNRVGSFKGAHRGVVSIDQFATAMLIIGATDTRAFSAIGSEFWIKNGKFRTGVIAERAQVALLNSASDIAQVQAYSNGKWSVINMPAPVHHLALSADGSSGAIAVNKGGLYLFDSASGKTKKVAFGCGSDCYITDVKYIDAETIVLGVLQATGKYPSGKLDQVTFSKAAVVVVATSGTILFKHEIPVNQPATYSPLIDVAYGQQRFAARMADRVLVFGP